MDPISSIQTPNPQISIKRILVATTVGIFLAIIIIALFFIYRSRAVPTTSNRQVLGAGFFRDKNHVYFIDQCISSDPFGAGCRKYSLKVLEDADLGSFTVIDSKYAKDQYKVYRYFDEINGADPATFRPLNFGYSTDNTNVFTEGQYYSEYSAYSFYSGAHGPVTEIENADPKTFQVLANGWAKDKARVYQGGKITDLDGSTFEQLGNSGYYFKDRNKVIYLNGAVLDLDPKTTVVLDTEMVRDHKLIYRFDHLFIGNVDVPTFSVLKGTKFSKDKNNIYFQNWPLSGADPETFRIVLPNNFYADKLRVYQELPTGIRVLESVDPKTVEYLKCDYLVDQNSVYFVYWEKPYKKIIEADRASFVVPQGSYCYGKDKNHVYENGIILSDVDPVNFDANK